MALTASYLASGQLSNASATLYMVPASTDIITPTLHLFNTNTTTETVVIQVDDGTVRQFRQLDIPTLGSAMIKFEGMVLATTYLVKGYSTTANKINYFLSGVKQT